jgi:hypothetical protein
MEEEDVDYNLDELEYKSFEYYDSDEDEPEELNFTY